MQIAGFLKTINVENDFKQIKEGHTVAEPDLECRDVSLRSSCLFQGTACCYYAYAHSRLERVEDDLP